MPSYDDIVATMKGAQAATGTAPNPYDDAVKQLQDENGQAASRAALSVSLSADQNPDTAAVNNALAKRYNTSPAVVATFPQEFRDRMTLEVTRSHLQDAPQLQQRIANQPQTAAIIHDDIPNAAGVEKALTLGSAADYVFSKGEGRTLLGDIGEMGGEAVKGLGGAFNKAAGAVNLTLGAFPAIYGALTGKADTSDWWFRTMVQPRVDTQGAFSPGRDASFGGKATNMAGNLLGMLSQITLSGTAGAAGEAPAAAGAGQVVAGAVEHGAKAMLFPALADAVNTGRDVYTNTGDAALATKAAQVSYLSNTAFGVVPMAAPGSLATRILTGFGSGAVMGEASRQAMNATLPATMGTPFSVEDLVLQGLAGSVLSIGGPRGERPGYMDAVRDTYTQAKQAEAAEQAMQRMTTLGQLSAASKWRERDPEGFRDFVNAVTEDGELANVYVEAKMFAQSAQKAGLTPEELQRTLPEVAAQLGEAGMTDGYIRIPTADYASVIAGSKLDAELLPNLKIDPEGKSYGEAQAFYQDAAQRMQEQAAELAKGKQEADAFKESQQRVQDKVQGQLDELGRFPSDVNRVYATVQTAILSRLAAREGISPEQAHERYAPALAASRMERGGLAQEGQHGPDADVRKVSDELAGYAEQMHKTVDEVVAAWRAKPPRKGTAYADFWDRFQPVAEEATKWAKSLDRLTETKEDPFPPKGTFNPGSNTIALLKDADLSTYLHETGHWALETQLRLTSEIRGRAARVGVQDLTPEELGLVRDGNALMKWFGVKSVEDWHAMSPEEQRPFHEQFARGFEAYLMEGKAPSQALAPMFQRIRSWMLNVYASLRGLNVQLSTEVRGVFDRMLASEEAIQEAQAARVFEPLFKDKPAGMTAEEWATYRDMGREATQDAIEQMQAKSLRDMKWLSGAKSRALKDLQGQAKQARDAVRREAEEEVGNEPVYRLQDFLKGKKLDKFDPEQLAEMLGFPTGEEALKALAEAPPRKEVIEGLTDRYMIERHGELSSPEAIDHAASQAIHNDARARFVATGLKILTKSPIPARELLRGAKEAADSAIAARRVRDLNPRLHEAAEAKSNRDALKLVASKPEEAALAQRAALLNNQLVRSTQDAMVDVRKGLDYFAKLAKDSVREKIDVAFRDQIDQLLARYDLRKGLSPEQAAEKNMVSLEAFVEKLSAMKFSVDVPEAMIVNANRLHYKDMTVAEFRGLVDAVKSLDHLGREVQKVSDGEQSRMLADVAAEAVAQVANLPKRDLDTNRGLSRMAEKWIGLKSFARSVQASLLKMEQMIDWLDHYNPNGVFNRMVFRKIADAEGRRNDLDLKISKAWEAHVAALPRELLKANRGTVEVPGVIDALTGQTQRLTWGEKIALAGIRGDAQHFSKLLKGERWDAQAVLDFLDKNMSKEEWAFVHGISGTFQELFPLKTAMLRELGSTAPKEVERIPFQTPHGELPGWYWPITYDPARSHSVKERNARHEASLFEDNIYTRADTSTGREQTRNDNYAKPMLLSIDTLPRVLKDEIRDITTRKAIIEADRFVSHPDVRRAIQGVLSPEHYDQINGWLLSLANDAAVKPSELQMWDRIAHEIRTRATIVGLGFRVSTMVMHGTTAAGESVAEAGFGTMAKGVFNKRTWAGLMGTLGPEWMNKGLESFARDSNWVANRDFIVERSAEMRHRMDEIERDVREQLRAIHLQLMDPATGTLERGKLAITSRAYQGIAMLDYASALPTWMGAYLKAMTPEAKGGLEMKEEDAVYFADKTVRNAHGGGGVKDMAAVQRGNEFQKLFTMFYTFWNHNINRIIDTAKRVKELPGTYAEAKESGDWAGFRGDVGTLILRTFMYTLGVQAVHHMVHPPKEEDGEEGWLKWFGKQMAMSAFGGVPIFRDIVAHYAGGKDYEMSPATSVINNTDRMLQDMKDGSTHERWIKHAMTEAGYLLGMPLGQPASTAQFLSDVWDGKQHPQDMAEWWRGLTSGDMNKH